MNKESIDLATANYLLEGISTDVVGMLMDEDGMDIREALWTLHNSETFEALEDFETGLYIESPAYVYDTLKRELQYGKLMP